jgi:hypothetical protein
VVFTTSLLTMTDRSDSTCLTIEIDKIMEQGYNAETHQELKRSSGVITPDAKEFCTKKHSAYREELYSSDEDVGERSRGRPQSSDVLPSSTTTSIKSVTSKPLPKEDILTPQAVTMISSPSPELMDTTSNGTAMTNSDTDVTDLTSGPSLSRTASTASTEIISSDTEDETTFVAGTEEEEQRADAEAFRTLAARIVSATFVPPGKWQYLTHSKLLNNIWI